MFEFSYEYMMKILLSSDASGISRRQREFSWTELKGVGNKIGWIRLYAGRPVRLSRLWQI